MRSRLTRPTYIGGNFTQVGDKARQNLAHIDASGAVTSFFEGQTINGLVETLLLYEGKLFLGGSFTKFNQLDVAIGARISSAEEGQIASDFPAIEGTSVSASLPDGSGGYFIAGSFTKVGDANRAGLAHINKAGDVTPFFENQTLDGPVNAMALDGGNLYIGGNFTTFNALGERSGKRRRVRSNW